MIVDCRSCGKRISSKYAECPHCGVDLTGSGEGLSIEEVSRREQIRHTYRIQAQLYLSILMAVAGVAWSYAASNGMETAPGALPLTLFAAGALWYVGLRIYMIYDRARRRRAE